MTQTAEPHELLDFAPGTDTFLDDVVDGLAGPKKRLPCKYLYDERGSKLFDRICGLDEYYPTRTEIGIMRAHGDEMARAVGSACYLIEFGSGSSVKTHILLDDLDDPAAVALIDISREHLLESARELAQAYPDVEVYPICADFNASFRLPTPTRGDARRVVYFPGSTIGNFEPRTAEHLLRGIAGVVGSGGGLLIGVDLKKDRATLEAAYNDAEGVTGEFNRNLLRRINRELDADFELDAFEHRAHYNPDAGRVESHLVSRREQTVEVAGRRFDFRADETIHTENSHKFSLADFRELADHVGLDVEQVWTDPRKLFSVQYLAAR